ncbi:cytochrome b/b6 domain-containing protein [Agromyces sp. H3Y2-19a]|uniref:cytochrome b/b6 domain-containing protein n=1 Tax=Agromyces chromiiresistens TaxID=3030835 RepID=UPI0023B9C578|nr:cytochrome b/b6 domain-containing protein [Agromyces chromiiresistens]MDF0514183.1 cytochrome b/b6 domain-containing protein [Agromyces chromiiresistens]
MATYGRTTRQGLPRFAGGDPWPPVSEVAEAATMPAGVVAATDTAEASPAVAAAAAPATAVAATAAAPATAVVVPAAPSPRPVRRGLPRVPGGEPWPPASFAPAAALDSTPPTDVAPAPPATAAPAATAPPAAKVAPAATPAGASTVAGAVALRRGLPRTPDGDPWPPAGTAPARPERVVETPVAEVAPTVEAAAVVAPTPTVAPAPTPVAAPGAAPRRAPMPQPRRATSVAASTPPVAEPWPKLYGPYSRAEWAAVLVIGGFGLLLAGTGVVVVVNWLLATAPMQDFIASYPGEYHLPESAPVGIPAWLGWQHFFNVFLIVLIIRSGLQVRTQKRPTAFWSPRWNAKRKISLALWFHQSLDILWLVNGVVFVVLLFATGQWMRIVPTSWEVFPNAISALLQYLSLDWPTENGWVNYNSLQQIAYFMTVFVAAPLAVITGVRMSGIWPKNAKTLNRIYPVEWARAVHFPVMLYFVAFIIVHVGLVFATGILRNLNHMYASQDAVNWVGFWIFVASLVVIAVAWIAARPLVLAPIARLFGKVSGR